MPVAKGHHDSIHYLAGWTYTCRHPALARRYARAITRRENMCFGVDDHIDDEAWYVRAMDHGRARARMRQFLAVVTGVSLVLDTFASGVAWASDAPRPADDMVGFDAGFRAGQKHYDRAEYLQAARTWHRAVDLLQESPENKENRIAVYNYIADAYQKSAFSDASGDIPREALEVLDAYVANYAAHYPFEDVPAQVAATRDEFRLVLEATEVARKPADRRKSTPSQATEAGPAGMRRTPDPRPWVGLTIGGGAALGGGVVMLAMFAGGLAQVNAAERRYDNPDNACPPSNPSGVCAEIYRQGESMDTMATVGAFAAPVLLGAGAAMLAIGLKRRSSRRVLTPAYGSRMIGLVWGFRF